MCVCVWGGGEGYVCVCGGGVCVHCTTKPLEVKQDIFILPQAGHTKQKYQEILTVKSVWEHKHSTMD